MLRRGAYAVCLALAACSAPPDTRSYVRLASPVLQNAVRVTIAAKEGRVRVDSDAGIAAVDFAGVTAHVRLTGGQRLNVRFEARAAEFRVELLEDQDAPVDIAIGQALIHATKGDIFTARVMGEHLDIGVDQGIVQVTGPDKRTEEIGQPSRLTVAGGGRGAVHGLPPPAPVVPGRAKGPPREPRRPPVLDRSDISPAP